VLTLSAPCLAANAEREALARLAHEIDALAPLVDEAQAGAQPGARVRFRYDWLRQDLERIRHGLLEHAHADQAEPRAVAPLRGDYRR
jgi:RAQPRD family integrative conjugative element protein